MLAPGAAAALEALRPRLAVIALLTGRAALDARRIAGDDALLVVGNHGAEWLAPRAAASELVSAAVGLPEVVESLLADVAPRLTRLDGVTIERKGPSATIHYRSAPDPDVARTAILGELSATRLPQPLELREGRRTVELRPRGIDKGSALLAVVERHGLAGVLVFGDDRTDLDAFRAAAELRAEGRLDAFIGAVGGGDEVPSEVCDAADAVIASPQTLVTFMEALAGSGGS